MTAHVTVARAPAGDRIALHCRLCDAGLVIELPSPAVAVVDTLQHFEHEHRECEPPTKGRR